MKITLTEVAVNDEIYIRTQNSEYLFEVSDPRMCRGVLTGGPLGRDQCVAFLAGVIFPNAVSVNDSKILETGTRALFYLDGKRGVDRLTTSVITDLVLAERVGATTGCLEAA